MNHRILITGGQGFLGRAVAQDWLRLEDTSILSIGRSDQDDHHYSHYTSWNGIQVKSPLPKPLADSIASFRHQYETQDINEQSSLCQLIQRFRPTIVIHLAGSLRNSSVTDLCTGNIIGVSSLLEAISGSGWKPDSIVLGSSGGVYGIPDSLPIKEDASCAPIDPYSASKLAAENMSKILSNKFQLPVRWARIFNCIGAGQDDRHLTSWVALQIAEIKHGIRGNALSIGDLSTTRDYIHARDVAVAIRLIALNGQNQEIYNVGSGEETSGEQIVEAALKAANLTQINREVKSFRPSEIPRHFADISKIKELGFEPSTDIVQCMAEMLDWYETSVSKISTPTDLNTYQSIELPVSVHQTHSYMVNIQSGILKTLPERLSQIVPDSRLHMVTDENVWKLYGESMFAQLKQAGFTIHSTVLPPGERSKSLAAHLQVTEDMNATGFQRRSVVLALGGGVISDLAGFVAATFMRGVNYINIPTTLLAQHDASVGGKTATNMPWAKNFVGSFHHPLAVFVDPDVLSTLEDRDIASGIAEAIKVAMCGEPNLFRLMEDSQEDIRFKRDPIVMSKLIALATSRKADILEPDPYEVDLRRILNLGHTIGHPLETNLMYQGLRHGEAVGFGLAVSVIIAQNRQMCSQRNADRIFNLLESYGLPPVVTSEQAESIFQHLDSVRRIRGGNLNFVLPTSSDQVVVVQDVTLDEIDKALIKACHFTNTVHRLEQ